MRRFRNAKNKGSPPPMRVHVICVPGVLGGDGEELDVYLLGVDVPVSEFNGKIIGIVHRHNDVEDKLVMAPKETSFTAEEIADAVRFQEQYYDSEIEVV